MFKIKYFEIKKKYMADALSYLGFRYFKFNDPEGISYSFEDNEKFREALNDLLGLKNKFSSQK